MVELGRRYSNHADQTKALVRTLEMVARIRSGAAGRPSVPSAGNGTTLSTTSGRAIDPSALAASYLTGATLIDLAARYGVSESTIKRALRQHGVREYRSALAVQGWSVAGSSPRRDSRLGRGSGSSWRQAGPG